jgi:hypothetical protein
MTAKTHTHFDVDLTLLPGTQNPGHVASLVGAFLRHIERLDGQPRQLDRDDVIQALSITAAIQMASRDAERRHGPVQLRLEHIEVAQAPNVASCGAA